MRRQKDNSSLYKETKNEKPGSEQDFRVFLFHFICGGLDHRLVTGYLSSSSHLLIHLYNRWKVLPEERKPYGRLTGSALMIIGGSIIITGILQCISEQEYWYYITVAGTVIGLVMIGYALLKYNRGIF